MNEIDWSQAPADATHYQAATHGVFECWLKPGHAVRVSRREPYWREDDYADDLIATSAIKRPWSGEGLPPVGVVCEFQSRGEMWEPVKVFSVQYNHDESADILFTHAEGWGYVDSNMGRLRPIRTPEQIAADEREAAIKEMVQAIYTKRCGLDCTPRSPADEAKVSASALYDAGYRKP